MILFRAFFCSKFKFIRYLSNFKTYSILHPQVVLVLKFNQLALGITLIKLFSS